MKLLIIIPLVTLVGCCTPTIERVPYEVKVQIKTPCKITVPEKPIMPFESSPLGEDIFIKTKKLAAEIKTRQAYEIKLEEAITECNK